MFKYGSKVAVCPECGRTTITTLHHCLDDPTCWCHAYGDRFHVKCDECGYEWVQPCK